jgi:hypothetical protein
MALARNTDDEGLTAGQMVQIDQLVAKAGDGAWYGAFSPSRECMSLKQGNQLAQIVLDARAAGNEPEFVLAQSGLLARDDAWAYARDAARALLTDYDNDLLDLTRRQYGDLLDALTFRIEDDITGKDTTRARDALSSYDRAEIVFVLSPRGKHALDASITSHKPWPEFAELYVTEDLAHALAAMGYTLGQYRKASNNGHATEIPRGRCRIPRPDFPRRSAPLCSWDAIREIVDNACSSNFLFVLYAMVPIAQLIDLDPSGPLTFSKAALASWDPWNGTFHDAVSVPDVTVTPKMGTLMSAAGWHSPDSICGFVHRYYEADIRQALRV